MSEFRVSLLQFGVALTGALLFLVVAAVLIRGLHPALERGLIWVRPGFHWLDRALALTVARWIGLDEEGRARRWGRLLAVLLGAGAIGALLPPLLGAPVLVLGLLAVLAVFRRWAWDEEDRAAGLNPDQRRTPGGEDYNNELLVALSAVFMLGSLKTHYRRFTYPNQSVTGSRHLHMPYTVAASGKEVMCRSLTPSWTVSSMCIVARTARTGSARPT